MAAPAVESTVFELTILRIRPGDIFKFLSHMNTAKHLSEKHGAKTHGVWIGESGALGQVYVLKEWASISARLKAREALWADPEGQKHYNESGHFLQSVVSYICKMNPQYPIKAINPKSHVMFVKMKPKTMRVFAAMKHREVLDHVTSKVPADITHPVATLYPLMYDDQCFITIWQVGENKVDEAMASYVQAVRDPTNWGRMANTFMVYEDLSVTLAGPICFDKLPKA